MLNISVNKIKPVIDKRNYTVFQAVKTAKIHRRLGWIFVILFFIGLFFMFFPWTQNIRAKGKVTTLRPEQRPQKVMSPISARIEKWYVREGQFVEKGDTIAFISEIKEKYLDPQLVERTGDQLKAKELSVNSYDEKIRAYENQIDALEQMRDLKLEQAKNKLTQAKLKLGRDSLELLAAEAEFEVAKNQMERMQEMYDKGIRSKVDFEKRSIKLQTTNAKYLQAKNKYLEAQNELINAQIELSNIDNEYTDKLAKARSDRFSALSMRLQAEGDVAKLSNQRTNYEQRRDMYYVRAPQAGYVTEALKVGLGETIKEGTALVSIMPKTYELAVSAFILPIDLPLLDLGQKVRIQFDGWPAIVFSGWENISYGTYGGEIVAIDNFANKEGMYRILIAPDPDDHPWPSALRPGSGAMTFTLLNDVPLWYETWRQFNGFPPDFYDMEAPQKLDK